MQIWNKNKNKPSSRTSLEMLKRVKTLELGRRTQSGLTLENCTAVHVCANII